MHLSREGRRFSNGHPIPRREVIRNVRPFKIMLKRLLAYFARPTLPDVLYDHPELGTFDFIPEVGWGKSIDVDGHRIQLYLGSNGEMPSQSMLDCLHYWIGNWVTRRSEINEYITQQCRSWLPHDTGPGANRLFLSSIEILWPEKLLGVEKR